MVLPCSTEKRNIVEKYRLQFARAGEQSTKIQVFLGDPSLLLLIFLLIKQLMCVGMMPSRKINLKFCEMISCCNLSIQNSLPTCFCIVCSFCVFLFLFFFVLKAKRMFIFVMIFNHDLCFLNLEQWMVISYCHIWVQYLSISSFPLDAILKCIYCPRLVCNANNEHSFLY